MHKLISAILSLILTLSLSACVTNRNADADGEIGGEITVSTYDTMAYKTFLEEAAKLFEEKYPGVTVNVETFSVMPEIKNDGQGMIMAATQDDSQNRADYINNVNTALMSGGGADVLAMDILPFYKYADGGRLENLAVYMQTDPEFNRSDYRENILDAVEYKNGIWFVPLDYSFNYYVYDTTLLDGGAASGFGTGESFTVEELVTLAGPSFDGSSRVFNVHDYVTSPRDDMWELLLAENYTAFVDIENKTADFDNGGFENLLESVKKYGEEGYVSKGVTGQEGAGAMMQRVREASADRFFFKPKNFSSLIALFTRNSGMEMGAMAEGDTMAVGDDDEIAGIAAADGSVPFTYNQAYGINANSQNKETAWAFLKFLLSDEMQLSANLRPTALPILNSAREKKMELMLTGMMAQQGQSLSEAHLEALAKYNEAVERFSDQIDAYFIRDTIIDDMIATEVQYFFEGAKTAAEVAQVLQNKADLYLNE